MKRISIIVPFYNEQDVCKIFFKELNFIISDARYKNEIQFQFICIDDGSQDNTLQCLKDQQDTFADMKIVELSRNFGKENALSAGLSICEADSAIIIDSDLQDPPKLIYEMIDFWKIGYDSVIAKRIDRESDTFFKAWTAKLFYKIHNWISDIQIPENSGDYRLIDRKIITELNKLKESNRFMKGLYAWTGFKTKVIEFVREKRKDGKSKFSTIKLLKLAIDGITSFSLVPLRISSFIGFIGAIISIFYGSYLFIKTLIYGVSLPGYASLMLGIIFFGSIQLLSVGILGEYLGRVYDESKNRPNFIIRSIHDKTN